MDNRGNFIDLIRVYCRSGHGGAGSVHFLRNKLTAFGGPDGGDGGRGAHIILRGNRNLWTLIHLRYQKNILAENGQNGSENKKTGRSGKDIIIDVPLGTIGYDEETGEKEIEITEHGEEKIWLEGGKGGQGNVHFTTATRQAPEYAQPGIPGKEGWKTLELKILADVGLVGFPNAGKSTLLSAVSAAKPKIANYAFTTLVPQLGIVPYRDHRSFSMADLPGIIKGASEGKGLGFRFLRHIERNSVLLFLIPADADDYLVEWEVLNDELQKYNPELAHKDKLLAISKSDLLDEELKTEISAQLVGIPHVYISSVTGEGIQTLKDKLWQKLDSPAL